MTSQDGHVITILHNNLETGTHLVQYEGDNPYEKDLTYFASLDQIAAIKKSSLYCEQYVEFSCFRVSAFRDAVWTAFNGKQLFYTYPDVNNTRDCLCRLENACREGFHTYFLF